ncbi:MAG: hypothetical protein H0T62_10365 [Parachlamydiaceae bacterium]|nr:hypothetical protein [Parachlamydiaceae bacterium]
MNLEPKISTNEYTFSVKSDKALNYCPGLSTIASLVHIIEKCLVIPLLNLYDPNIIKNCPYLAHVDGKKISKIVLLMIPGIGNIIYWDMKKQKANNTNKWLETLLESSNSMETDYLKGLIEHPKISNKQLLNVIPNLSYQQKNKLKNIVLKCLKIETDPSLEIIKNHFSIKVREKLSDQLPLLKENLETDFDNYKNSISESLIELNIDDNCSFEDFIDLFQKEIKNRFDVLNGKNLKQEAFMSKTSVTGLTADYLKLMVHDAKFTNVTEEIREVIDEELQFYRELSTGLQDTLALQIENMYPVNTGLLHVIPLKSYDYEKDKTFTENEDALAEIYKYTPEEFPVVILDETVNNIAHFKRKKLIYLELKSEHKKIERCLPKIYPHLMPTFLSADGTIKIENEDQFKILISVYGLYFNQLERSIQDLNKIIENKLAFKDALENLL